MQNEPGMLQKIKLFIKAFSEFLGRPKTVFDIKDRLKLILLLVLVIAVLEAIIWYVKAKA
ncbi:MAG: hypothetical protein IJ056_08730 [Acidaminococcaceae bacterium]|nr:hypothetical protein [Acidaminococcaceae bacterium]MBQ9634766.1 hypothetical protein [Acidaminococcaceae bacterium]MBR1591250.1 hypothetical protein [Acidaminococcaceae bacterium]